ncbi:MAG TPA: response regulator [Terrimicrobiaceae bacterium]|nr:response regulator [Terrimicrobiaceae bacterium]
MPDENGLALVPKLKEMLRTAKILMLTGYGSIATAMEAVKMGCADYLTKPVDSDQIEAALEGRHKVAEIHVPSLDRVELSSASTSRAQIRRFAPRTSPNFATGRKLAKSLGRRTS